MLGVCAWVFRFHSHLSAVLNADGIHAGGDGLCESTSTNEPSSCWLRCKPLRVRRATRGRVCIYSQAWRAMGFIQLVSQAEKGRFTTGGVLENKPKRHNLTFWGMSKGCYADPHRVFPELGLSGDGTVSATRQRPGRVAVSVSDTCYVIQPVLVLCSVFGYPVELL